MTDETPIEAPKPSEAVRATLRRLSQLHRGGRPLVLRPAERAGAVAWVRTLLTTPVARPDYFEMLAWVFPHSPVADGLTPERAAAVAEAGPDALTDAEVVSLLVSRTAVAQLALLLEELAPEWVCQDLIEAGRAYEEVLRAGAARDKPAAVPAERRGKIVAAHAGQVVLKAAVWTPPDDADLLVRVAKGDTASTSEFYERWFPQFARLARRLTGSEHVGEDVAQEACVRVIVNARKYELGRPARPWLLSIVYHLVQDWARRGKVRQAASLSEPGDGGPQGIEVAGREPAPEERVFAREREAAVGAALTKLSAAEREIILLRDYEGLTGAEAAGALGITAEMVGSRLFRARRRLGGILQSDWPELFPSRGA